MPEAPLYKLPDWAISDRPCDSQPLPDGALDLTPYPTLDDDLRVAAQCGERILSRTIVIAALALLIWMAIGVAVAWHAGRLG